MNLIPETILALAPDSASAANGRKLATPARWQNLDAPTGLLWGQAQGSGKDPYLVGVDLNGLVSKCTCPSRKFPCKHALALMLLYASHPSEFGQAQAPESLQTWLKGREQRAESKEQKAEGERQKADGSLHLAFCNNETSQTDISPSGDAGSARFHPSSSPPLSAALAGTFVLPGSPLPFPRCRPSSSHHPELARGHFSRYSCGSTPAGIVRPGGAGGQGWRLRRELGIRPRPVPGVLVEVGAGRTHPPR